MGAKTVRKVRIAAIFAGKVLLEVIFGRVSRGWGPRLAYAAKWERFGGFIYPKIYPKIYGNPTTHLGGEIPKIVGNRGR